MDKLPQIADLSRRFQKFDPNAEEEEQAYLFPEEATIDWQQLLSRTRVVLLAPARAGKSTELQLQVAKLTATGEPAFFIRLNQLAESTLRMSAMPNEHQLDKWLQGSRIGWLFLDARDELSMTGKQLLNAFSNLRAGLAENLGRARIVVTSRPTDWKSSDLDQFIKLLPPPDLGPNEVPSPEPPTSGIEQGEDSDVPLAATTNDSVLVVHMVELNEGRAMKLAAHFGVDDLESLRRALSDKDALSLTGTPGDVIGIVAVWKEHGTFRNYEEIVQSTIKSTLKELRDLPEAKADLSVEQYNTGARRLAATMVLSRGTAFMVGPSEVSPPSKSIIHAEEAFTDWQPKQLDAVLRTNLFEPRTRVGLVRFRNRTVKEYLAAQWIIELHSKFSLRPSDMSHFFFSNLYDESTAIPSMAPVAAWVAMKDGRVRAQLLERSPDTLLEYGDPGQLSLPVKQVLLKNLVANTLKQGSRLYSQDGRLLRALAIPDLVDHIRELWKLASKKNSGSTARYRQDALLLLLKLIQLGRLAQLANIAAKYSLRPHNPWIGVIFSVRALVAVRDQSRIKTFVAHLKTNSKSLERKLVLGVLQDLYPEYLTAAQVIRLVDAHQKAEGSVDIEPGHTISALVKTSQTRKQRLLLLRQLVSRWTKAGPLKQSEPYAQSPRRWIVPAILQIANIFLEEDSWSSLTGTELLSIFAAVQYSEDYIRRKESRPVLHKLLAKLGREKAFWILLRNFEMWHAFPASSLLAKVNLISYWMPLVVEDLTWLLSSDVSVEREATIWAALRLWHIDGRSPEVFKKIMERAEGDPVAAKWIEQALNSEKDTPDEVEYRLQRENLEREREKQRKEHEKSWVQFRAALRENPNILTVESTASPYTKSMALWYLYSWLTQPERMRGRRNIFAISDLSELDAEYGVPVREAAAAGFKSYWRSYESKLPSALKGIERNQTSGKTIVSLTGLAIEAGEGGAWIDGLTKKEVTLAVRHAFREMNGFPSWLRELATAHAGVVTKMFVKEIRAELSNPEQGDHAGILARLSQLDSQEWSWIVQATAKALGAKAATNRKAFTYAIEVLMKAGDGDKATCEGLYRQRLSDAKEAEQFKVGYLAAWFALDADVATDVLLSLIRNKAPAVRDRIVENVFAQLSNEVRRGPMRFTAKNAVKTLERLLGIAYRHIRNSEDIRHLGVYSPGPRDHAQTGRDYLVKSLTEFPGEPTYRALIRLAAKPELKSIAGRLLHAARTRALEDSEIAWRAADVLHFEQETAKEPQTARELFELILRQLDEIRDDLESGDFSQAALLKLAKRKEDYFQTWVAEQLELRSRRLYTVTRESQVRNAKRPDIVVQRTKVNVRIPLEIKVAESWSGTALRAALDRQLIGQYQIDRKATHGLLLLIGTQKSKRWRFGKKMVRGVEELTQFLRGVAKKSKGPNEPSITTDVAFFKIV
jgi:hypothetical protein